MNSKHKKLYEHYTNVFQQEPAFSMKLKKELVPKGIKQMSTFVFSPTELLPFWKLCTIGASDYLMPEREIGFGRRANRRNEYVMFISPDVDVSPASTEWLKLNALLWRTAQYACEENRNVTVSDTIEMDTGEKYCGTVLLLPEVLPSRDLVKCYTSAKKFISIFQVMPITREQILGKLSRGNDGTYWLMEQFYTHDEDYNLISSNPLATL